MKNSTPYFLLLLFLLLSTTFYAQVGIGTANPNEAAILDIESNDRGLLIPRLPLNGADDLTTIFNPVAGLIIYNTVDNGTLSEGFVFYDGDKWTNLGWQLDGNIVSPNSFLGTLNDEALVFKANNLEMSRFKPNGSVTLGLGANSTNPNNFAIGTDAQAINPYTIILGNTVVDTEVSYTRIGIGTSNPQAKLHLNGTLRLQGLGGPGAALGSVLTSDANGNATWQPSGGVKAYGELTNPKKAPNSSPFTINSNTPSIIEFEEEGPKNATVTVIPAQGNGNAANRNASITLTISGVYRISYSLNIENMGTTATPPPSSDISVTMRRGVGEIIKSQKIHTVAPNSKITISNSFLITLSANDVLTLWISRSGSSANLILNPNSTFNIELVD